MTIRKQEALLNELKGNLFEFLIGNAIAKKFHLEREFSLSIHPDLFERLLSYQRTILAEQPRLLRQLQVLSDFASGVLLEDEEGVTEVKLVGKDHTVQNKGDADLLILKGEVETLLSIKLVKSGAYVNTKSGGVKSFLTKYFGELKDADSEQDRLNNVLEISYQNMIRKLGDYTGETEIVTTEDYKDLGLTELPGELPQELREVVHAFYSEMIAYLYRFAERSFNESRERFLNALRVIMGLGEDNSKQLICFYKKVDQTYTYDHALILDTPIINEELKFAKILPLKDGVSYFSISFKTMTLQIRLKPMNKFTGQGLKVNCSVKYEIQHD